MTKLRVSVGIGVGVIICALILSAVAVSQIPAVAAGGLLHPARHRLQQETPENCESLAVSGAGIVLRGWRCRPASPSKGTVVYLHGIADNRGSGANTIKRYLARGLEVVAYDSRAHGESDGSACTYGYFEKEDLIRVLDTLGYRRPVVLIGTSLGAAVAIQAASRDSRISAVVAAETFSDLRTVATERAPWVLTDGLIERAFRRAERDAHFEVDAVSPLKAARDVRAPVLLIHGREDVETRPAHSERVLSALAGPKRLILVDGAGHNQSLLRENVWAEIDAWIDDRIASTLDASTPRH